jgi:hypothetical protein
VILLYIPNHAAHCMENAREVARGRWPACKRLEERNPERIRRMDDLEVQGVQGVVVASGFDQIAAFYAQRDIPVERLVIATRAAARPTDALPLLEGVHMGIVHTHCDLPALKLIALVIVLRHIGHLRALFKVESSLQCRPDVLAAITRRINSLGEVQ